MFGDEQLGLDLYEDSIGKYDDGSGGRPSTSEYLTGDKLRVVWEFAGGLIYKGEHSWFLVYGSDYAPVVGDYEIQGVESEPPPIPEVPEPVTVALLGFGAALAASVRRVRRKHLRL